MDVGLPGFSCRRNILSVNCASSQPAWIFRIAALAAILASGLGKTVHLNQECSCCDHSSCPTSISSQDSTCPLGCDDCPWAARQQTATDRRSSEHQHQPPTHDEQHCAVCQVLAQAPDVPVILGAPEIVACERMAPVRNWQAPDSNDVRAASSRGPPTAGPCPAAFFAKRPHPQRLA